MDDEMRFDARMDRARSLSLEWIRQDARFALRAMRRNPAFAALSIVTPALGISVNAASLTWRTALENAVAQSIANRRVRALPAIGFGLLALAAALVGLLATLLTLVAERRRDLAIRSALGASPRRLVLAVVAQGLTLTALGLAIGLAVVAASESDNSYF